MYQSPIEIITRQMRTQFEDNVFKAIQDYGIAVDKDELIKALQYDREQYEKGYRDGLLHRVDEWISVEERLPENGTKCLVYTNRGKWLDKIEITHYNEGFYIEYCEVTHWMPLPEPPKMRKEDEGK